MSKSLITVQKIFKVGKILSLIVFVVSIVGAVVALLSATALLGLREVVVEGEAIVNIVEGQGPNYVTLIFSAFVAVFSCIAGAIIAKLSSVYFSNELEVGTPFTRDGANELLRLGIISLVLPVCVSFITSIAFIVTKLYWPMLNESALDGTVSIALPLLVILLSFVFKYGAELEEKIQENNDQIQ